MDVLKVQPKDVIAVHGYDEKMWLALVISNNARKKQLQVKWFHQVHVKIKEISLQPEKKKKGSSKVYQLADELKEDWIHYKQFIACNIILKVEHF